MEVAFCVHLIEILCVPGPRYPCWPKLTVKDGFFKQATLVTEHIFLLRFFFFNTDHLKVFIEFVMLLLLRASLVAQRVKNPPPIRETWV